MKKIITSIFIITVLASCSSSQDATKPASKEKPEVIEKPVAPIKNNFPVK